MKRIFVYGLALCAGSSLALVSQHVLAETPSQADIAGKLYPIPGALQETRGISIGRAAPAAPMATHQIRLEEPMRQESGRRAVVARPAVARSAPVPSLAALPGCPKTIEAADKPAVSLPQIAFDFGSAQLRPEAIEVLRNLGKALNDERGKEKVFLIEGHTDAIGTFEQNEELSRSRAEAVRDFLVRDMGIARDRLGVVGKAYCEPDDPQHPYDAKNRRVVVVNQNG